MNNLATFETIEPSSKYLISSGSSSSIGEIAENEYLEHLLLNIGKLQIIRGSKHIIFIPLKMDSSSIQPPKFEQLRETFLKQKDINLFEENLSIESDFFIKMPPKKEWKTKIKIKEIIKAKPKIYNPEAY